MKCPICGGKGKYKNGFGKIGVCYYCLGTGKVNDKGERVKTEQEYIQTCTTEQLAEVLFSWYKLGRIDVINKHTELKKDWLIGWLKQPHTNFVRSRKW